MIEISLVVPCYNEEDNVQLFYQRCLDVFEDKKFEVVFVNDGSKDNTFLKLKELYNKYNNVIIVNFSRNFGKESGIYCGLQNANGKYISIIDADLQQDPQIVLEMCDILDGNSEIDIVSAYQNQRHEGRILAYLKKLFYRIINSLSDVEFRQDASDFRTFRRSVLNSLLDMKEYFRFSKGLFAFIGFNTYYLPYEVKERANGTTKWSFKSLLKYAVEGVVSFSVVPLHIATFIGILIATISFVYAAVVIAQKIFFGINVPGYATLVILVLFIGGIQLLVLGIIGKYLANTYIQGKDRPIYIIKEILMKENAKDENK